MFSRRRERRLHARQLRVEGSLLDYSDRLDPSGTRRKCFPSQTVAPLRRLFAGKMITPLFDDTRPIPLILQLEARRA